MTCNFYCINNLIHPKWMRQWSIIFPYASECSQNQIQMKTSNPTNCSTPGSSVLYYLPGVCSDSCPLSWWCHPSISSSATPLSFCLQSSQHQDLFQWVSSSHQMTEVLELQLQHQSFQWMFRFDKNWEETKPERNRKAGTEQDWQIFLLKPIAVSCTDTGFGNAD